MSAYSEQDLAGLSEEEKAALTGEEADTTDEALADIAGDDDDDAVDDSGDDDNGTDQGTNDTSGDQVADDKDGDDKGAADDAGTDTTDHDEIVIPDDVPTVEADPFIPRLSGEVLPEYQTRIDALDAKFEEGELTMAEHRKQVRKLEADSQNAEISTQLEAHNNANWQKEQAVFFKHNPQYNDPKNRILIGALNQEVIRLANDERTAGLSGIQILYAAKVNVEREIGAVTGKQAVTSAKADDKKSDSKTTPKPKAAKPTHQTLADIPASAANDTDGDRFAYLDRLDGLQLEAALNKLSKADYDAYVTGR